MGRASSSNCCYPYAYALIGLGVTQSLIKEMHLQDETKTEHCLKWRSFAGSNAHKIEEEEHNWRKKFLQIFLLLSVSCVLKELLQWCRGKNIGGCPVRLNFSYVKLTLDVSLWHKNKFSRLVWKNIENFVHVRSPFI